MISKPKILDLFCGAGGAAMGLHRAGFEVYGIDIKPQPHYPFPFRCMDALEAMDILLRGEGIEFTGSLIRLFINDFDAYWASPPCQHASTIAKQNRILRPGKYDHPDLIPQTREVLIKAGKPYIIENVVGAALVNPIRLCGSWFGLRLHRHRLFETNFGVLGTPCSHHWQKPFFKTCDKRCSTLATCVPVYGHNYYNEFEVAQKEMGIDWMDTEELNEAIPPAYSEYLGKYLMQEIESKVMAL